MTFWGIGTSACFTAGHKKIFSVCIRINILFILKRGIWVPSSDIVSETSAITEVQTAEKRAGESVQHATEEKTRRIAEAHEKARKILEDAQEEAKAMKEQESAKAMAEAEKEAKKIIADAEKAAAKIKKAKPTSAMIDSISKEIANKIVGE